MKFGTSEATQKLLSHIDKVANTDASILITGETGTGKEVVANTVHSKSPRRNAPFVAVNCAAIPTQLIQTELFGHEKGAFTGAHETRIGKIEQANRGTLFLDEIGDLPLPQQANLLRVLQEKVIVRVGGRDPIAVDVRVIAATHVEIERAIKQKTFREDLYYRLNILHLHVARLRDRHEDIEDLARHFIKKFGKNSSTKAKGITDKAMALLQSYPWPGNVRELSNCIHRAVMMSENSMITPEDLGLDRRVVRPRIQTLKEARGETEKKVIQFTLRCSNKNVAQAAQLLGVTRATLYRLIEKHHIDF